MEKLDQTVREPLPPGYATEQHLADDRRLFERIEHGLAVYGWRLWEADTAAVVLGRFGNAENEVFEGRCQQDGVPIVRRFSGGGAVVVGRGCLNFTVAFALPVFPELVDVARSFSIILHRLAAAFAFEGLSIEGTDLVAGGRKVSGNAQRRGRRALLHHGTLLYDFDPALAARYLREPRRQPAYREHRPHADFMGCLPVRREVLTARISDALAALAPATEAC